MLPNKLFQKLHYLIVFILLIMFVFLPLEYIKYIAWIPIAVSIQWFIFDGCLFDKLHTSDRSGNCASCLKLFNTKIAPILSSDTDVSTLSSPEAPIEIAPVDASIKKYPLEESN